jgi:predicted nucleic acid-binding protein
MVRPVPNPGVVAWIQAQRRRGDEGAVSTITIGEIEKGIARLPRSIRRDELVEWLENDVLSIKRILPVTVDVARQWGRLEGRCRTAGVTLTMADGLIASTALIHGLTVATNNVRNFEATGVRIENPWTAD